MAEGVLPGGGIAYARAAAQIDHAQSLILMSDWA